MKPIPTLDPQAGDLRRAADSRRSTGLSPVEQTRRYHEETKHHFRRYARSLGYLDWANQPDPFRRYDGAALIELPLLPEPVACPRYDDLFVQGRVAPQPLTLDTLSRFLEYALSITAWKQAGDTRWALRANPSSGNLHPTEGYVVMQDLTIADAGHGPAQHGGVFHYAPKEHGLERRAALPATVLTALLDGCPDQSFVFGLTSIHWREAWKYGERAFRYCQHDVGHALGSARIAAAALGWRMTVLTDLSTEQVATVLGVDRDDDYQDAPREHADCLVVVYPADSDPSQPQRAIPRALPEAAVVAMAGCQWFGRANRLGTSEPVLWDIIDEVAEATVKPPTTSVATDDGALSTGRISVPECASTLSAHRVIHQRRSAVSFDGQTGLAREAFYRIVSRLVPQRLSSKQGASTEPLLPPWDLEVSTPAVHLLLFVHRIDGLPPGLYCVARTTDALPRLQAAIRSEFSWTKPAGCPDDLPLWCLGEGDARQVAAQLSCHQDIAGASVFSLGMLAEFDRALTRDGAWAYPRLFWECGLIGQMLYLEAEACGIRGTGIGCFFDDGVHELLGLRDTQFQSLYHFTVGGLVDDHRLTTLPPYKQERRKRKT
ncbi:MAG: SagB/ThcOx family dehydrogenase [Nitrospiraceae bacterium]